MKEESVNWQHSRALVGLAAAQLHRIGRVGFALPLIAGALVAVVGVVLIAAVGARWTTAVVVMLMPLHSLVVGLASVGVLAGDPLVELHGSTPVGERAVQTMRGALLALAGMAGAFVMFAPLHLLGVVYGDVGWASAATPVGGAAVFVLSAYAAAAAAGSPRGATFCIVLIWVVLSFFWDTNLMTALALQRGVPLVAAAVAAVGAWLSLGKPERVCAKAVGTR